MRDLAPPRARKSLTTGVQGPRKGPGSFRAFRCSIVLSEPYRLKHSDTKWDTKNIVDQNLGRGGGGSGSATVS